MISIVANEHPQPRSDLPIAHDNPASTGEARVGDQIDDRGVEYDRIDAHAGIRIAEREIELDRRTSKDSQDWRQLKKACGRINGRDLRGPALAVDRV